MLRNQKCRLLLLICLMLVSLCMVWPAYKESRDLKASLTRMDISLEVTFNLSKSSLLRELKSGAYSPRLAEESARFSALCFSGGYLGEYKIASDPLWWDISWQLNEVLENPDIFQYLTEENIENIISFLESHEYRNDPAISEDDVQSMRECTEPALELYAKT